MTDELKQAALQYAELGWPVLPLYTWRNGACACGAGDCASPAKHPLRQLAPNGLKNATTNPDTIDDWWTRYPTANIGLRTGDAFDVLDIDGHEGADNVAALCDTHGDLPAGPTAATGGGGYHYLFLPTGVTNRAGIVPKVDWRGRNGYIVAAPSLHASGNTYTWTDPADTPLEAVPDWLHQILDPPRPPRQERPAGERVAYLAVPGQGTRYGIAALEAELDELSHAVEGTRNHSLNAHAFNLYQLVAGGELDEGFVYARLQDAATGIGLTGREIEGTLRSARNGGMANPRYAPALPPRLAATGTSDGTPVPNFDEGPIPDQAYAHPERMTVEQAAAQLMRPFQRVPVDLRQHLEPTPLLTDWLYGGGCLTVLQSEPGVGKSWVALWLCIGIINAGHDAIYIDEEGGLELVHERLTLLGADPDLIAERFHYFAFETRTWGEEDMLALTTMLAGVEQPRLVVLDSLPDFLAVAGQDEDRAKDVTAFIKKVCGAFREVGCSQLLLDHLTKPSTDGKKHRSRYSRGSGSKLGKADATLLIEAEEEFDTHTSGKLRAWKTKDRRGRLPLPNLTKSGRLLAVTVSDGSVRFDERLDDTSTAEKKPTVLMERISMALEGRLDDVTQNGLLSIVNGNATYKRKALEHLVADGYVARDKQGQAFLLTSIKPYRKPEEDRLEDHESWQP